MSKFGIDWTASDETSGERDAGHLLSCLEFAWNCLASHGLLEQAQQLAERIDSKRCARLSQAGAGGGVAGVDVDDLHKRTERAGPGFHVALSYREMKLILAALAPSPSAVPAGWKLVPIEPTPELLHSMAVRYDHGLGVPGYYDQPVFGAENVGHAKRLEATITTMRQLYEEVVGTGFYRTPPATPVQPTASVEARPLKDFAQPGQCNCGDCLRIRQAADLDRRRASLTPATPVSEPSPSAGEIERLRHERDCLAQAIGEAAQKAGITAPGASLTGPMLMLLCDDLASAALSNPAPGHGEALPVAWRWRYPSETEWYVTDTPPDRGAYDHMEHQPLYAHPAPAEKPAKQEDGGV